mmetsp:Transcript_5331/g.13408  ORF Transcript_5331/g.13408 Transcript_5331/m.13408 type:complete len:724 (+) Transcript_5331:58-2229(+)
MMRRSRSDLVRNLESTFSFPGNIPKILCIGHFLFIVAAAVALSTAPSEAFTLPLSSKSTIKSQLTTFSEIHCQHFHRQSNNSNRISSSLVLDVSKICEDDVSKADHDADDDEELLRQTKKSELISLCRKFKILDKGTKEELLGRLRAYATTAIEEERRRLEDRKKRIEDGVGQNDREKYEIVNSDDLAVDLNGDHDDKAFVYFEMTGTIPSFSDKSTKAEGNKNMSKNDVISQQQNDNRPITPDILTAAPPPPGVEPNENGERVVTIYSTADQNDLTGVAAAQPGQAAARDPMTGPVVAPENTPWDFEKKQNGSVGYQKPEVSSIDLEAAKEEVTELVHYLLSMTGAPGFVHMDGNDDEDNELLSSVGIFRQQKSHSLDTSSSFVAPEGFVGFDPTKVSVDALNKASRSIRMTRGSVLLDVTREFELRAVGYDGSFGDDERRGGGHYRQVSLVRSFLEGFRRAEVRRLARETVTMLLDRLVQDGIEGLDLALSSMTRSGDDVNQEGGELNDSLIDYLNDAIRQQERKVEQVLDSVKKVEELERSMGGFHEDKLEELWTVENEDGKRVEIFDPKDPKSKIALQDEYEKSHKEQSLELKRAMLPRSAQERLLLLLKLLRERVKIEAAFSHDEKSQNLRVLAYCLNLNSDELRKELIMKEFGSSLDRLQSFSELVSSSIAYGESSSHQVQPNKVVTLNVPLLERILALTREVIKNQSWKASGGKTE